MQRQLRLRFALAGCVGCGRCGGAEQQEVQDGNVQEHTRMRILQVRDELPLRAQREGEESALRERAKKGRSAPVAVFHHGVDRILVSFLSRKMEEEEEEETRTRANDVCCRAVRLDTMMLSLPNPRTACIALSLFHSLSLSLLQT